MKKGLSGRRREIHRSRSLDLDRSQTGDKTKRSEAKEKRRKRRISEKAFPLFVMESSSLWAPIYRRFRISGISYRYIRMHGEKAPTSPKSYRRWVSDQSPVWMGQVFKLKANFPLLKEGPGGEKGEVGSSNWIRRRYELRYLEMEMYQCGRDSSSSASSTAASLSLSLSPPPKNKKKKEKENSALRIEYIGYMEYKQE